MKADSDESLIDVMKMMTTRGQLRRYQRNYRREDDREDKERLHIFIVKMMIIMMTGNNNKNTHMQKKQVRDGN